MKLSSANCKMLLWNVWSIANEEKLTNLIQILEDKDISIACITETWFDRKSGTFSRTIKNAGYDLHHAFRENKRGGGCAIIYKKNLSVKKGEASTTEFSSFEYSYVTFTVMSGRKVMIICIYRKQEISFNIFHDEWTSYMEKLFKISDTLLVMGDFNVWADRADDKDAEKLCQLMNGYGLTQMVEEPTQRSGHTLDHIYLNQYQIDSKHEVLNGTMGLTTDHLPIILHIPMGKTEGKIHTVSFRKLKDVDLTKFKEDLQSALNKIDSVQTNFVQHNTKFDEESRRVVEEHAPIKTWQRKEGQPVWLDQEYRKSRLLRRKYERIWKKDRSEENMNNYIQQKKLCTEMVINKQTKHYTKLVTDAGNCQKTLFKVANELLDKNNERVLPQHTDSKKLANEFNKFYIEKIQKIRQKIPHVEADSRFARPFQGQRLEVFEPTTEEELKELIKEFGVKTSVEDPIPAALIKVAIDVLLPVYKELVNKSLAEGTMETAVSSVIDPLLKKLGLDIDVNNNYRPVNNLIFFSKLTERVVQKRIDKHMTINALHEPSEFGYKTHHNTETMMIGLFDDALRGFDENQATIVVFLDLSAAFDTIDPDKLLQILHDELGIGGVALQWFRSFLTGRTQRVKVNDEFSDSLEVPCGTPQGSVLGPPLFNINVRSQPKVFQFCKFSTSSFADDSNGRKSFALKFQFHILKYDVVKCMNLIIEWSHAHFMKINPDKTEFLLLYPPSLNKEVIIKGVLFEDQCIRFSEFVKNVGVWIDKNLTLDKHVNNIVSHCYKILKDIGSIKKSLQKEDLEKLVHAAISSRLDYCNGLLMNVGQELLRKLQKLQNTAARLVLGKRRRDSARQALRVLHWLNVESRIVFKTILLVFKVIRGTCSDNLKLQFKQFNRRPGDFLLLETPNYKTKHGKRLFDYNGSRLWNALPYELRMEEDVVLFKKGLKTLLFDGCDDLKNRAFKYGK
jgi:exonuclease III